MFLLVTGFFVVFLLLVLMRLTVGGCSLMVRVSSVCLCFLGLWLWRFFYGCGYVVYCLGDSFSSNYLCEL